MGVLLLLFLSHIHVPTFNKSWIFIKLSYLVLPYLILTYSELIKILLDKVICPRVVHLLCSMYFNQTCACSEKWY